MSEDFLFADEPEEQVEEQLGTWKILVVDDEPEVHAVTKLALSDFVFQDRKTRIHQCSQRARKPKKFSKSMTTLLSFC